MEHLIPKQDSHGSLSLRPREFRLGASDYLEPPVCLLILGYSHPVNGQPRSNSQRQPQIMGAARRQPCESWVSYSDNREADPVQSDRLAHCRGSTPECPLPVAVVEHGNGLGGGQIVGPLEGTAQCSPDPNGLEELTRNEFSAHHAGRSIAA